MTRGGQDKTRAGPERRCIATGATGSRAGLIRFVVGPDMAIVPDILGKLPGRGIWVAADRAALERAVDKRLFGRAAKAQVSVPEGLVGAVEDGLVRRVIDLVSMARKAGKAVAGFEKTKGWLISGEATLLLQASDGSPRERSRLRPPPGSGSHFAVLTASELGLSFGRDTVIHCALATGRLSKRVIEDASRLQGLRDANGGSAAGKGKKTT